MTTQVTVVGAGIIGLSCAVRLAEAGHEVDVLARDLPAETTSAIAGGLWKPYLAFPADLVARWARETHAHFLALAGDPEAGVRLLPGVSVGPEPLDWAATLGDLVDLTEVANPLPGFARGYLLTTPMIDTPRYLAYLARRLAAAGGTLTRISLPGLPDPREGQVVVNATGLSARGLVPDATVHPIRGQVVHLADPGLMRFYDVTDDDGTMTYVFPHGEHVVVGGTATPEDWSRAVDPAEADRMVARAVALVPALRHAPVIGHRVGLRPARGVVRLEVVRPDVMLGRGAGTLVHCYGHGGSGITTGWGCAGDVLKALAE